MFSFPGFLVSKAGGYPAVLHSCSPAVPVLLRKSVDSGPIHAWYVGSLPLLNPKPCFTVPLFIHKFSYGRVFIPVPLRRYLRSERLESPPKGTSNSSLSCLKESCLVSGPSMTLGYKVEGVSFRNGASRQYQASHTVFTTEYTGGQAPCN